MSNSTNKFGLNELLLFVGFICLIFSFLVSGEITSDDLFMKIFNIILLVFLAGIGFVTTIKSIVGAVNEQCKITIILNSALLLAYVILLVKIIYTAKGVL